MAKCKFSLINGITIEQIIKVLPTFDGLSVEFLEYISEYKKDLSEYSHDLFNSFSYSSQIVNSSLNSIKNCKIENNGKWIFFDYTNGNDYFECLVIGYGDKICIECFSTEEKRKEFYENI